MGGGFGDRESGVCRSDESRCRLRILRESGRRKTTTDAVIGGGVRRAGQGRPTPPPSWAGPSTNHDGQFPAWFVLVHSSLSLFAPVPVSPVTPATLDSAPILPPLTVNLSPRMPCPHYTYYPTICRLLLKDSKKKVKSRYGPNLVTGWELPGIGLAIRASAYGDWQGRDGLVTCLHGATYSLSDVAPDWMPPVQGIS